MDITCPYCTQSLRGHPQRGVQKEHLCPKTNLYIPSTFISEYNTAPPVWIVCIGFSRHGKSTYLSTLMLLLESLGVVWPNSFFRPLNQFTIDTLREMRRNINTGKLTPATQVSYQQPLITSIHGIPAVGSRSLVLYDVAGELYNNLLVPPLILQALAKVNQAWLFVSLPDLQDDNEMKTANDLLGTYLSSMEKSGHTMLSGRTLLVVYTKGDIGEYPREVREYLLQDPFQRIIAEGRTTPEDYAFSPKYYLQEMNRMSNFLRNYTKTQIRGGASFISMALAKGLRVEFCITSALGETPDPKQGVHQKPPGYRVIDPFLWSVFLSKP